MANTRLHDLYHFLPKENVYHHFAQMTEIVLSWLCIQMQKLEFGQKSADLIAIKFTCHILTKNRVDIQ